MKKTIGISLLILMISLVGCTRVVEKEVEVMVEPEEQAMVSVIFDSWGENMYDSSEVIFSYNIINYGFVEAKDIKVKCYVANRNDELINSVTDNAGNIASTSFKYGESYLKIRTTDDMTGFCYAVSCDNCVLLNQRLTEIQSSFK